MDDDKNAARNAISELEQIPRISLLTSEYVVKCGFLAIAKTLWLIAMILLSINNKLKK